jgi:beta-N-acetylhexosaminidase
MKLPRSHHMSVEALAGQILMPALHLEFMNRKSPEAQRIIRLIRENYVSGFILFGGHPADIRFWTGFLQKESKYPLLFAADLERGLKSVFAQGTMFPHNLCFGATGNKQHVIDFAEVVAKEARAVGINMIFAPVLDLSDDPQNPIVNIRAWHSDPEAVSEYGQLFIETVQEYGIACVAKHFPGHGSTKTDSHVDLPVLTKKLSELEKEDLIPFRMACETGVKGMMAGHLKLGEFDLPASMESKVIQNLLRDQLKYDGVVFTDALEMGAIRDHFKPWQQALFPIEAGADILLMSENFALIYQLLTREIQSSDSFKKKVEAAVERVFRLKKGIHKRQPAQSHPYRIHKVIEHPDHLKKARTIAEESITLIHRSKRFPLRLPAIDSTKHIIFTDARFDDQPLKHFCSQLQQFFDSVEMLDNPSLKNIKSFQIAENSVLVISLCFRTFARHAQKMDWKSVNQIIHELKKHRFPLIIFLFGNPYHIKNLAPEHSADAMFLSYSYVQASQEAAFRALSSFIPIEGNLPVHLEKPFHKGIHLSEWSYKLESALSKGGWKAVDKIVERAIQNKYFPGGVLLAAKKGEVLFNKAYGRFDYNSKSPEVKTDTIYDLASLTKVLATTPVVMRLIENGDLSLEKELSDFYPQLESDEKGKITIADLLLHQSGLPAWKPFYEELRPENFSAENKPIIVDQILDISLEYETGSKAVYSDLGFILLLDIIEKASGGSFDTFCREQIFQPMDLASLQFNPAQKYRALIPPTGKDAWRGSIIQGDVNDNNCFAMEGVSTHAGLFGSAKDVAAIGQMFIQKGIYDRKRHFRRRLIETFSRPVNPKISNRSLGWDTPGENSSSGKLFSKQSIGHLGFTGCSMWMDLKKEIIVVFLCNRVHPDPRKNQMDKFRPQLHDAIMKKLSSI